MTELKQPASPRTDALQMQFDRVEADRFILKAPQRDELPNPWAWARQLEAENSRLVEAMREFCDRTERGEVRSKYTYAKFKALLTSLQGGSRSGG